MYAYIFSYRFFSLIDYYKILGIVRCVKIKKKKKKTTKSLMKPVRSSRLLRLRFLTSKLGIIIVGISAGCLIK